MNVYLKTNIIINFALKDMTIMYGKCGWKSETIPKEVILGMHAIRRLVRWKGK